MSEFSVAYSHCHLLLSSNWDSALETHLQMLKRGVKHQLFASLSVFIRCEPFSNPGLSKTTPRVHLTQSCGGGEEVDDEEGKTKANTHKRAERTVCILSHCAALHSLHSFSA